MPRLPSRDDVDGRAAPRASYNVPDFPRNPVPAAIMQLGQTVASVGAEFAQQQQRAAAKAAAEAERRQKLALQTSLLQMEAQWGGYADATESSTSGDPGVESGGDPGVGGDVSGAGDVDYDAPDPGVYVAPATSEPGSEDAVPVDPAGTTTKRVTEFDTNAKKFMASVPDEMKPYADLHLYKLRTRIEKRAAKYERKEGERFYSVNLSNGLDVLLDRLHSNPEEWQEVFKQGEDLYDLHPTASPGQKAVWKEKWRTRAGKRLFEANPQYFIDYQKQQEKQPAQPKESVAAPFKKPIASDTLGMIKKFEGFSQNTYWDVNHYRAGYGSDTITDANGNVRTVRKGDRVSRADADRDLARRVALVEKTNAEKYGEAWTRLDGPTKAALTSITYNYGEIPKRLLPAMRSGDKAKIAAAVRGLAGDNDGINRMRRMMEAQVIAGEVQIASNDPTIGISSTEPQIEPAANDTNYGILGDNIHPALQSIPYEERLDMHKKYEEAEKSARTEAAKARNGELDLGIETGTVTDARTILDDQLLDDNDKATLLRRFNARQEEGAAAVDVRTAIETGAYLDASDTNVKKGLNRLFNESGGGQGLVNGDETALGTTMYMWQKGNVIADDAKQALQTMARSPDDQVMVKGLAYLDELQRKNPQAFDAFFKDDATTKAVQRYNDLNGYVDPDQLAGEIRKRSDPEYLRTREPLRKIAEKQANETYDTPAVVALFDERGWYSTPFLSAPDAPKVAGDAEMLAGDFRRLYADAYAETGDDAMARNNAFRMLTKVWSPSFVNGGAIMRHAPEKHYPTIDGSHKWMKDQLEADLKAAGYVQETNVLEAIGGTMKAEELRPYSLRALPLTEAQIYAGRLPQYAVIVTNPVTGEPDMVTDDKGRPMLWPATGDVQNAMKNRGAKFQQDQSTAIQRRERVEKGMEDTLQGEGLVLPGSSFDSGMGVPLQ